MLHGPSAMAAEENLGRGEGTGRIRDRWACGIFKPTVEIAAQRRQEREERESAWKRAKSRQGEML